MAQKDDDIPLTAMEHHDKSAGARPNGESEAATYCYAVSMEGAGQNEKLLDGHKSRPDDSKLAKAAYEARLASNEFTGLSKEELAKYSSDPYWRKVRIILFIVFWLVWIALLVAAIVIIVVTPKCPPRPDVPFYQKGAIYKVLPLSFAVMPGSASGMGHLIGLEKSLGYIKSLGASTVAIGPILGADSSALALYDGVNYTDVDSRIGHFSPCLQKLTKEASKQGLKVLIEAQINFASVKHPLFLAQLFGPNPTNGSFVIRRQTEVTSNLIARDNQSAWRDVTNLYPNAPAGYVYYSSFTEDVVEWDFSTSSAVTYALETVKKLLQQDIDGVIIKDASFLVECSALTSMNETTAVEGESEFAHSFWKVAHPCTLNQNESVTLVRDLADLVAKRNIDDDRRKRVLLVEVAAPNSIADYQAFVSDGAANGAFLDTLTHVGYASDCDVECVRRRIEAVAAKCVQKVDVPLRYPVWHFSTPEYGRYSSRFGNNSAAAFFTLGTFLPGGFGNYYGDEVGVMDVINPAANSGALFFDGGFRSTMQWSASEPYAGFLASAPPNTLLASGLVAPTDANTYLTANTQVQLSEGYGASRTKTLQKLLSAKKDAESAQWGTFYSLTDALVASTPALRSTLIAFARVAIGFDPVVVVVNGLGRATSQQVGSVPLNKVVCDTLRNSAEWASAFASTENVFKCDSGTILFASGSSELQTGNTLSLANVFLEANQVIVIRVPKTSS